MIITLPLILALVVVAWLTAGGMAVRSVSRIWLRHWAESRLRGATAASTYLERPHRLITAASTGVALTIFVSGELIATAGRGSEILVGALIFAGFVILFGQLIPRAVARRWANQLAPALLPMLETVGAVTAPITAAGRAIANALARRPRDTAATVEHDDIQDLLREGELEGVGEHEEIAIITGVVAFSDKVVREIMTARSEIFALEEGLDARAIANQVAQSGYSRVPIYRVSLDTVVGMVHAFDIIKAGAEHAPAIRPVTFTAPEAPCNELLFRMLRERLHLAIVRDDAGRTLGLVALEDLLEELVGDIRDEHDEPAPPTPEVRP
jgi:magnesium and cobalt exporter, CNNM family